MTIALYPASFDPITYGHIDIAERAAALFNEVILGVFAKPSKNILFSPETRLQLATEALAHIDNIRVTHYQGLTVNYAREVGANVIVRGLRTGADFEWEMQLSQANHSLAADIETVCLVSNPRYTFISSSIVKEIALNGGDVSHLVPSTVMSALINLKH